jgi:hypothetical protein
MICRRNQIFTSLYQQLKLASRKWKKFERTLSNDRGPWSNKEEEVKFWKLDKFENPIRERKRLKRNYEGVDHSNSTIESLRLKAKELSPILFTSSGKLSTSLFTDQQKMEHLLLQKIKMKMLLLKNRIFLIFQSTQLF